MIESGRLTLNIVFSKDTWTGVTDEPDKINKYVKLLEAGGPPFKVEYTGGTYVVVNPEFFRYAEVKKDYKTCPSCKAKWQKEVCRNEEYH